MKKWTIIIFVCLLLAVGLLAAYQRFFASGTPSDVPQTWRIGLEKLKVIDAQEEGLLNKGDDPYFVMIGFRSRFNTRGSTKTFWNGYLDEEWASGVTDGDEREIPNRMGQVSFTNVKEVSGTKMALGAMPEVIGALVICVEGDTTPFGTIRDKTNELKASLEDELRQGIENGAVDLDNPGPDIKAAIARIKSSVKPDLKEGVGLKIRSMGNIDDIIDVHFFLFVAIDSIPSGVLPFPESDHSTIGILKTRYFGIGTHPIVFSKDHVIYHVAASVTSLP